MIALGIDPGARWTGLALIEDTRDGIPRLIASTTIDRGESDDLLDVPDEYLLEITELAIDPFRLRLPDVVGVEWVRRPSWRVKGKAKPLDPSAIMATALVVGAVYHHLAHHVDCPVERIRPLGNGRLLPLRSYPNPLGTDGKGTDRLRHERSAYDVAMMAVQQTLNRRIHP